MGRQGMRQRAAAGGGDRRGRTARGARLLGAALIATLAGVGPTASPAQDGATAPAPYGTLRAGGARLSATPINSFGMPGMIDMPVALAMPDGTIAVSAMGMPGTARFTLTFQIAPRLTGSFRYSRIERPRLNDTLFDRSFDIQYQILHERPGRPGLAIGLRDFIGTGEYSSEYVVATGRIGDSLRLTGGIGWGRLATSGGFRNPLGAIDDRFLTRPGGFTGTGGRVEFTRFFRGDAALFGGVEWQATDRLRLMAEYSGDAYRNESAPGGSWRRRTPVNIGASYQVGPRLSILGFLLHGDAIGLTATVVLNPDVPMNAVRVTSPPPVLVRPAPEAMPAAWSEDWAAQPAARDTLQAALARSLAAEGLRLESIVFGPRRVEVRYANLRHEAPARAVGRAARILTAAIPPSVEEFVLVSTTAGMPVTAVTLRRSDLERLEHAPDGTEALLAAARITDGIGLGGTADGLLVPHPADVPRFGWSIQPYIQPAVMDPSAPLRIDFGLRAEGRVALASNLLLSGAVTQRLAGNISGTTRALEACRDDGFCYERVRSDAPFYSSSAPVLERLTVEHFSRPGPDLFGRLSAGYLERMFAGVSAELLWKPVDSRLALGAEINRVRRRDPGSALGFTDYEVTTGHISAYYDFGRGYTGQIDVGQFLAGDRGATVRLEREFASGWRLGAYATITDMPFSAFGEGSFDKGITVTIPFTWFDGQPSRNRNSQTIRSLARDGGARLEVTNRLHPMVREMQGGALRQSWGTVWQ